jgi:hypothetical protein
MSEQSGYILLNVSAEFDPDAHVFVAGSPALDVWDQAASLNEAIEAARTAIGIFLNETTRMGTVWTILKDAGIAMHPSPPTRPTDSLFARVWSAIMSPPHFSAPAAFQIPPPAQHHGQPCSP